MSKPLQLEIAKKAVMHTQHGDQDWSICTEDEILLEKIIPVFEAYLKNILDKGVSKSTFNRHKSACHALGGYIVGKIYGYGDDAFSGNESGEEILLHYIDENGGPLIHHDNETWQREVDAMCKKLFCFL